MMLYLFASYTFLPSYLYHLLLQYLQLVGEVSQHLSIAPMPIEVEIAHKPFAVILLKEQDWLITLIAERYINFFLP